MKSVLLLSAGRRVSLLRAFEAELCKRDARATVYAADMRPGLSSACAAAKVALELPAARSERYAAAILDLCHRHDIGLVVPTIDTELLPLAEARSEFEARGVAVAISSPGLVRACRDKRLTDRLFRELGLDTPQIYDDRQIHYPCFGKPLDGSRSINAVVVHDADEMRIARGRDANTIFMELIDRSVADEYTVDLYYDRTNSLKCIVPRKRIEVRDGEVSKGITIRDEVIPYLQQRLAKLDGALGCLTLQLFRHCAGNRYWLIELNPRFGGGYPLSYAAGANFPGWMIGEYLAGEPVPTFDGWEDRLLMLRHDSEVFVHGATY